MRCRWRNVLKLYRRGGVGRVEEEEEEDEEENENAEEDEGKLMISANSSDATVPLDAIVSSQQEEAQGKRGGRERRG